MLVNPPRSLHLACAKNHLLLALFGLCLACAPQVSSEKSAPVENVELRVALFNVRELSLDKIRAESPHPQLEAAARIVARVAPDVLVIQEIDWVEGDDALAARELRDRYLEAAGAPDYPYVFSAPTNTGLLTGIDLDGDGHIATSSDRGERRHGNDSFGYGVYPGQYAMAVLSRFPVDAAGARTFQKFLWRDMPGHLMPPGFYSAEAEAGFRLSSKSHWDLPIEIGGDEAGTGRLHLLVSHPTPGGFDGEEDRNGRRNSDEIRLWADYLDGADWIVDDEGNGGGYAARAPFVIVGDLNARPNSEPTYGRTAISQLLQHSRVQESGGVATSEGALAGRTAGPPDYWERATTGFREGSRIDYVLPSTDLEIMDGGVFWPPKDSDPDGAADAELASDHRLVWLDLRVPG